LQPEEDLPYRARLWLDKQPANSHLSDKRKIASLFPNGPHLSDYQLDIIVADGEGLL